MAHRLDRLLRALWITAAVVAVMWVTAMLLTRAPSPPQTTLSHLTAPDECTLAPVEALASTGLSATSVLAPDGTLYIAIAYPHRAAEPADQGAQAIWNALDAAAALAGTCPLRRLDVTVQSEAIVLRAEVAADDLAAWATGEIDDQELVERVSYTRQTVDSANR